MCQVCVGYIIPEQGQEPGPSRLRLRGRDEVEGDRLQDLFGAHGPNRFADDFVGFFLAREGVDAAHFADLLGQLEKKGVCPPPQRIKHGAQDRAGLRPRRLIFHGEQTLRCYRQRRQNFLVIDGEFDEYPRRDAVFQEGHEALRRRYPNVF